MGFYEPFVDEHAVARYLVITPSAGDGSEGPDSSASVGAHA
jgi:hypothetical protein